MIFQSQYSFARSVFTLVTILSTYCSYSQITVVLDKIPTNTPVHDTIYIVGDFNNWNPSDINYKLTKNKEGKYYIRLPENVCSFQYKFSRGSWETAEGTVTGSLLPNRFFISEKDCNATLHLEIKGWEDISVVGSVTFLVTEVPENTPHDASIYITGNFNNWNPSDLHYRLKLFPDSTYKVTIPVSFDSVSYKFTRGNWASVECRKNGRVAYNRTFVRTNPEPIVVKSSIDGWEDLDSGGMGFYVFILLMASCQSAFLIIAINALPNKNKKANTILSLIILVVALSLIGKLASYESAVFNFEPKILLLADIIYFLIGPMYYLYMQKLLTLSPKSDYKKWLHFLPFGIQMIIYLPLLFTKRIDFVHNIIDRQYYAFFATAGGVALVFNIYYWFKSFHLINQYREEMAHTHSFDENLTYLSTYIKLSAICLIIWCFSFLVYGFGYVFNFNPRWINEISTDILWVFFSVFTYFLGFFAITQPEVFSLMHHGGGIITEKNKNSLVMDENILKMKDSLSLLMLEQKPYQNPKLSLQDLADMMDTNIHTVSRLINEGYHKNFYDFINEYRIEAFQKLLVNENFKNHTFLSLAMEVGFSSKTTFYRAFKKSTGKTPKSYFAVIKDRGFKEAY